MKYCLIRNTQRLERHEMFDFIPIMAGSMVLAMYPQPPKHDMGLFVRPFQQETLVSLDSIYLVPISNILEANIIS